MVDQLRHWFAWLEMPRSSLAIGLTLAVLVVSFVAGLLVTLALPPDYFVRRRPSDARPWSLARVALLVVRNLIGGLMFLAGLVMAVPLVPGPGLVFMLIGAGLVDFPGKRALELRLLRRRHVLRSVNGIRARFGRAPLQTSESDAESVVDKGP